MQHNQEILSYVAIKRRSTSMFHVWRKTVATISHIDGMDISILDENVSYKGNVQPVDMRPIAFVEGPL